MKQYMCIPLNAVLILFAAQVSMADEYAWDQTNDYFSPQVYQSIQAYSPIGQEFTPNLSCLEVVQLYIYNESEDSEFVVSIYSDSITGTLLGTSNPVAVSGFYLDVLTFSFSAAITLTPQNLYVIKISQIEGTSGGVSSSGGSSSTYPYGCQILSGIPQEDSDLWFREGVLEGSPLERFSWAYIKTSY